MSQINNIITTTFRAQGGNVVSQLNSYAQGFGRLGQSINDNTQMSSRLNNQWRAIGTTIRYAVAGTAIFGLQQMVRELSQVNTQLGQMQALTVVGQGGRFSDTQMGQLLSGLMDTSTETITPLNEVNDAAINFLSTVQGVKANELPGMLSDIGIAAKLSQASMEDVTQAATTMQIAFGRKVNRTSVGEFSRMFQYLINVAPGGAQAGSTIAQAMPGLATMFQMAPGRGVAPARAQAQMMALTQGVLMTGMPAATGMRGLTYLLQSIAQPTGAASKTLAGAGITPEFVQQHGIFSGVMKLLNTIRPVGKREQGRLAAIPEDQLDTMTALPGIPANEMQRLRQMIPRIHGIRAAIILASQLQQRGDVQSIAQDLTDYVNVQDENSKQAKQVARASADFRRRARMQEAAIALHNAGLQLARAFDPLLQRGAGGILHATHFMHQHQRVTQDVVRTGGGIAAALMASRLVPGLAQRIPLLGKLSGAAGQTLVRSKALEDQLAGSGQRGFSPGLPLYVTVVGQLFGGATPSPTPPPPTSWFGKVKGWGGWAAAARGLSRVPGEVGGGALTALGAAAVILDLRHAAHQADAFKKIHWSPTGRPYLNIAGNLSDFEPSQMHQVILSQARRVFGGNVQGVSHYGAGMWHGQADVNMTITREGADGRLHRQRVHIPVDMWAHGRHPSHRGRKNIRTK